MPLMRALGLTMIKTLSRTGMGTNAIIRLVRKAGYGYSNLLMGQDVRRYTGRFLNEYWVKKTRPDEIVSRWHMVEAELKRPYKYQVFGEVTYWDSATDTYVFDTGSLYTDHYVTPEEWEERYIEESPRGDTDPEMEVVGFKTTSVEHNVGYEY